jgi:hypothetical protein
VTALTRRLDEWDAARPSARAMLPTGPSPSLEKRMAQLRAPQGSEAEQAKQPRETPRMPESACTFNIVSANIAPRRYAKLERNSMTDEQLDHRFTQIAQAFEHLLIVTERHSAQIGELIANDSRIQARIEAIAEVTNKNSEEIARITREWQAYLRTRPPQ